MTYVYWRIDPTPGAAAAAEWLFEPWTDVRAVQQRHFSITERSLVDNRHNWVGPTVCTTPIPQTQMIQLGFRIWRESCTLHGLLGTRNHSHPWPLTRLRSLPGSHYTTSTAIKWGDIQCFIVIKTMVSVSRLLENEIEKIISLGRTEMCKDLSLSKSMWGHLRFEKLKLLQIK